MIGIFSFFSSIDSTHLYIPYFDFADLNFHTIIVFVQYYSVHLHPHFFSCSCCTHFTFTVCCCCFFFYHVRVHMSKWPQRSGYQWQTRTQPEQSKLILSPTVRIFQVRGKKTKLKSFLIWCNSKFRSSIVSTWLTQINTAQAQTFEPVQTSTCANKNSSSAGVNTYFWY